MEPSDGANLDIPDEILLESKNLQLDIKRLLTEVIFQSFHASKKISQMVYFHMNITASLTECHTSSFGSFTATVISSEKGPGRSNGKLAGGDGKRREF